ncbi:MAG: hypothetical protein GXO87_05110 [Chlorobi bacterium]|nr:hypothetical protein [Chlorobiota bacterium]
MKNVLLLFAMLITSITIWGQRGERMTIDEYVKNLTDELELTQSQADSVKMILEDQREDITKLKEQASGDRRQMRSHMPEIIYATDKRIELLLSGKQKEAYRKYVKERRSKRAIM